MPEYLNKRSIAGTAVGGLTASLLVSTSSPVQGEASAAATNPVMVAVAIPARVRESGSAYASVLPSSRISRSSKVVDNSTLPGTAYSMSGSELILELDPAQVPKRYVDASGLVTVQVNYADPRANRAGSVMRTVRAISTNGARGWIDPGANRPSMQKAPKSLLSVVAKSEVAKTSGLPATRSARTLLTSAAPNLRLDVEDVNGTAAPVAGFQFGKRVPLRDPIGGVPKCGYLNEWQKRWATIGTSYPLKGSKSWLTYTSSSSSFGTAVSMYGGLFKGSGTRTLGDDWGQNFAGKNFNRSFRVQVRYRLQKCFSANGREISRTWIPQWETGGTSTYKLSAAPSNFNTCAKIARGAWYRGSTHGRDYSLSFGVKFRDVTGVDLTARRAYSKGARLYYESDHPRRVCGNDDDPARASRIRERKR